MISFCIITDGKEPQKLLRQIISIGLISGLPEHEIIVSGDLVSFVDFVGTEYFRLPHIMPMPHAAKQGRLGALRNGACQRADGEILVVTDDDMLFHPDWWENMEAMIGPEPSKWKYDLIACRILNPDGSRYWDWKCHENGMNWLLDYDKTDPRISLTGGYTCMKREVFQKVKWNNELGFNQAEDVDFSNRVKAAGFKIIMNPYSTITHNAGYTQKGQGVVKL